MRWLEEQRHPPLPWLLLQGCSQVAMCCAATWLYCAARRPSNRLGSADLTRACSSRR